MFGGDTSNLPPQPSSPLGVSKYRVASNQQAKPVPYVAGKVRIGVTWISDPFATKAVAVYTDAGKGDSQVTGYNYYADIAGLVCCGPVDAIYAVYLNQQLVWGNPEPYGDSEKTKFRNTDDSVRISLDDFDSNHWGVMDLYWGTETQVVDPVLNTLNEVKNQVQQQSHPAYRGFCYVVFKPLYLGFNQTNVQNVELVIGRWPRPDWMTGISSSSINSDCNPAAFVADLAQHPRGGLSVPQTFFDVSAMNATAARLDAEGFAFSPVLTDSQELRQTIVQANEYYNGYVAANDQGQFAIGLVRPPGDSDVIPVIDATMMVSRPTFQPEDWSNVTTETSVQYTNVMHALQNDVLIWRDAAARDIKNSADPLQLDRSWLTSPNLVQFVAETAGKINALPGCSGKVTLRKTGTLFDQLVPGALFQFNYSGRNVSAFFYRVTERRQEDSSKPQFEISFTIDYSFLYPAHSGVFSYPEGGGAGGPGVFVPSIGSVRCVELPLALCPEGKLSLALLSARMGPIEADTSGYNILIGKAEDGVFTDSFASLEPAVTAWCLHGTLVTDYPVGANDIDITTGLLVEIDGVDTDLPELSLFDALSDRFLVFVGNELMSIAGVEILAERTYQIFVARGRLATPIEDHATGDEVYIIEKSSILPLQHPQITVNNTTRFKLQPIKNAVAGDLADSTPIDYTTTGLIFTQTPPTNLKVNGAASGPTYASGSGVSMAWTLTEAGRDYYQPELYTTTTLLEFINGGGTIVGSQEVAAGVSSLTLSNSALVTLLGGSEIIFTLRAKTKVVNAWFILFSNPISINVTKL